MGYKIILAGIIWACSGLLLSCKEKKKPVVVNHLAETGWRGSAGIYVDRFPNKAILKEGGADTGRTSFYCLRIGLYDSTTTADGKQGAAKEKYFQLDMYKDWVLLYRNDSISPVFSQSLPRRMEKLTEQVLVYEVPKEYQPGTLVYKDPYGLLGNKRVLVLNEPKP